MRKILFTLCIILLSGCQSYQLILDEEYEKNITDLSDKYTILIKDETYLTNQPSYTLENNQMRFNSASGLKYNRGVAEKRLGANYLGELEWTDDFPYKMHKRDDILTVKPHTDNKYLVDISMNNILDFHHSAGGLVTLLNIATLGGFSFTGISSGYWDNTCKLKANIRDSNNNILKEINLVGYDTAEVKMYTGYHNTTGRTKVITESRKNALEKLFEKIKEIPNSELVKTSQQKKNQLVKLYGASEANKMLNTGKKEINAIINQEIFMGMSEQALVDSWGKPQDINVTTGSAFGIHKQYVYGLGKYVYIENGKVTS